MYRTITFELPLLFRHGILKIENIHVPTGQFALAGFGYSAGKGEKPRPVKDFIILRGAGEKRNGWHEMAGAQTIASVYGLYGHRTGQTLQQALWCTERTNYYFRVWIRISLTTSDRSIQRNGVSERTPVVKAE